MPDTWSNSGAKRSSIDWIPGADASVSISTKERSPSTTQAAVQEAAVNEELRWLSSVWSFCHRSLLTDGRL